MTKLAITTFTGIVFAVAAGILSAPVASSAPQGPDAANVIRQLESEGYIVIIDRLGSGAIDQCEVTGIRNPRTITRIDRSGQGSNSGDHSATTITSKTISVRLDCS